MFKGMQQHKIYPISFSWIAGPTKGMFKGMQQTQIYFISFGSCSSSPPPPGPSNDAAQLCIVSKLYIDDLQVSANLRSPKHHEDAAVKAQVESVRVRCRYSYFKR